MPFANSSKKKPRIILGPVREVSMFEIIRTFTNMGIEVIVFDPDPGAPGFFMSGISEKLISPAPDKNKSGFIEFLKNVGKKYPGDVLLVNDDLYTQLITEYKDELKNNLLFLIPDESVNSIGSDKAMTAEAAAQFGIPSPKTFFLKNGDDNFNDLDIDFPVIIKPRMLAGSRGQFMVKNREDLVRLSGVINTDYIIQEWIQGDVKNLCTLGAIFDSNSQPKAVFTARRLDVMQSKSVNQGITTYLISERIPDIIEIGVAFLKKIRWQGIAELEFKFDEKDSEFKLLEINPRVWSWIKLPMRCGVDFPMIYYDLLCGRELPSVFEFRTGVTYLRSVTHIYSQFYRLFTGGASFGYLCRDLIKKYSKIIFNSKDNLVDELPWIKPNLHWMLFYYKRLKEYG